MAFHAGKVVDKSSCRRHSSRGGEIYATAYRRTSQQMIIAKFRVKNEAQTLRPGYDYLVAFLEALKPFYPKESWHCLPRSMTERSSGWIPVMNEDKFLRRSAQDMGDA